MLSCIVYSSLKSLVSSVFKMFPESDRFFLPAAPLVQANIPSPLDCHSRLPPLLFFSFASFSPFPAPGQGQARSHHSPQIPLVTSHFRVTEHTVVLRLTAFPSSPVTIPPSFFAAFFLTLLAWAAVISLLQGRMCRAHFHGPLHFCTGPFTSFRIYSIVTLPRPLLATPSEFIWSRILYPSFPVKPFLLFLILSSICHTEQFISGVYYLFVSHL